jgi:hypothetical protein
MPTDRLTGILGALTALYALYIAIALSWSRIREALCNKRRRDMSLLPYTKLR